MTIRRDWKRLRPHSLVHALRLCKDYALEQPGERGRLATERSPYGVALDVRYPDCDVHALVAAAQAAEENVRLTQVHLQKT